MLYAIVAVLAIIIDQVVKYWITQNIGTTAVKVIIKGVISLVNVHNDGAAFSFLAGGGARIYFIIITGVFVVAVILALATRFISGSLGRWSLVLVAAGGLSNCIDRIIYGYVVDMFRIDLFDFAVFNVADIFITVFCLIFIIHILFGGEKQLNDDDEDDDDDDDYDDEPVSEKKKKVRENSRKGRQSKYEDEYEKYRSSRDSKRGKAEREAAEKRGAAEVDEPVDKAPSRRSAASKRTVEPSAADPFAEWERANARVESEQRGGYSSKTTAAAVASPARPARSEQSASATHPVRPAQTPIAPQPTVSREVEPDFDFPTVPSSPRSADMPVMKSAAPKKPPVSSDFDLDDILNEFK